MKIRRIAGAFCTCAILFWSVSVQAADDPAVSSIVLDNKEKLIKTKSCPGCNLVGVNLNRADLSGADLQGADLSQAKLFLTNLAGANLRKAKLQKAGFGGADLANADLREADLRGASLDGAYLRGAKFDKEFAASVKADEQRAAEAVAETPVATAPEPEVEKDSKSGQETTEAPPRADQHVKAAATPPAPPAAEAVADQPSTTQVAEVAVETEEMAISHPDPGLARKEVKQEQEQVETPPEAAVAVQEAPPVKTVQPMGEPVITEEAAQESSAPAQAPKAAEEQNIAAVDPGGVQAPAVNTEDTAVQKKLAQLVKSKNCFGCDLTGLDLAGRNLQGADLEKADLSGCNLEGADLDDANLKGAMLVRANLKKASLKGADLYKADFTGADLTGANMRKALVDEAQFTDAIGVSEEVLKQKK